MKKLRMILLTTPLLTSCATFAPQPGMTLEQFKSMTALSFNGSVINVGRLNGTDIDCYETYDQNFHRVTRNENKPADGWKYYCFKNSRMVDQRSIQALIDQRAAQQAKIEADKRAAIAKQQQETRQKAEADAKEEAKRKEQRQSQQKLNQF